MASSPSLLPCLCWIFSAPTPRQASWQRNCCRIPFLTGVLAGAFRDGDQADRKAAGVLYALIAGLMCGARLPAFRYLHRHPELVKPSVRPGFFARQLGAPDHRAAAVHSSGLAGMVSAPPNCGGDLRFHNRVLCLDEQGIRSAN